MKTVYSDEKHECQQCQRPTKRINIDLELPSCSATCDDALKLQYLPQECTRCSCHNAG